MRNADLISDGGMSDARVKEIQREFHKAKLAEHEDQEQYRREIAMGLMKPDVFDNESWDAETEKGVAEFNKFATKRDDIERKKTEAANGAAFLQAFPRFKKTEANATNVQSFLTEHHLPATLENLQKAYINLEQILDLAPEPIKVPRVFTEQELYRMPLDNGGDDWGLTEGPTNLLDVCNEASQQNMKLEQIALDGGEDW